MANEMEPRIKSLEDREEIIYEFIEELRAYSKKLDRQLEENKEELKEFITRTDERLEQNEEMVHAIVILQGDTLKLLTAMDKRVNALEERKNGA